MPGWLMLIFAFGPALLLTELVERRWPSRYLQSEFDGKGKYVTLGGWLGTILLYKMLPSGQFWIATSSLLCLLLFVGFVLYSLARAVADEEKNMEPHP
ncbi:MAG: hypothetical protein AMXMBFR44_1600 [Candidatus Campbellbacteria bacterium]